MSKAHNLQESEWLSQSQEPNQPPHFSFENPKPNFSPNNGSIPNYESNEFQSKPQGNSISPGPSYHPNAYKRSTNLNFSGSNLNEQEEDEIIEQEDMYAKYSKRMTSKDSSNILGIDLDYKDRQKKAVSAINLDDCDFDSEFQKLGIGKDRQSGTKNVQHQKVVSYAGDGGFSFDYLMGEDGGDHKGGLVQSSLFFEKNIKSYREDINKSKYLRLKEYMSFVEDYNEKLRFE
jgi:hypothetical protein